MSMSPECRVYKTELGWVAADAAGWLDEIFETEEEAREAVEIAEEMLPAGAEVLPEYSMDEQW